VLYAADTYNNAIRAIDAETGNVRTLAGVRATEKVTRINPVTGVPGEVERSFGKPGASDEEGTFDEPAGITLAKGKLYITDTNNHLIRTIDLGTKKVGTLAIAGLTPPEPPKNESKPSFPGAHQIAVAPQTVKPVDGAVKLNVALELGAGWKINELAPMAYYVEAEGDDGVVIRDKIGALERVEKPAKTFDVSLPVTGAGKDTLKIALNYYYCQEGDSGLCKVGSVVWTVPLTIADDAEKTSVFLLHQIKD
jgi:hypothetical protein